ncbi:DUF4268 domain-containing protein [Acinetobacter venetianus]|uniref:DUF4268 domain-containing protein n=1 Tax=Acinetobacter venetianus TaxID=52133 RepID=UPI0007783046|nr:DUF4268 domain-containing protein [Acinetobacter venetianus]KXZ66117.1 Endonuclease NucS [Acinetobacter venetianus]RZG80613.1 DUF4268 domain-containing protein [Acinetobacter venetianus]
MSLFTVDITKKRLMPLNGTKLSEQQLTERYDLQEWLVHHPDALGEPLLMIQKEFSNFDGTKERLDLLALDIHGNLVLIENKRDESGKDVVWQAIKYASYVAPFTTDDIEKIYADYLQKYRPQLDDLDDDAFDLNKVKQTAKLLIDRFLAENQGYSIQTKSLNTFNSQRIILVAGEFGTEVTSTALWLCDRGIDVKCVKVSPYLLNEQLLIHVQQIIPIPEATEYMVRLGRKEAEDVQEKIKQDNSEDIRYQYWNKLLAYFTENNNTLYNNISAKTDHWLNAGSGISFCPYSLTFLQKEIRIGIEFSRKDKDENKRLFDFFYKQKEEIEAVFGQELQWLRLDDRKSSRIQYAKYVDGYNNEIWQEYIIWHLKQITRIEEVFKPLMKKAYQDLEDFIKSKATH